MSYTPTNWATGDTITAEKLNKLEQGVASAGALVVSRDEQTGILDHTWAQINAAAPLVWLNANGGYMPLVGCINENGEYRVAFAEYANPIQFYFFAANSADGYPAAQS